MYAHTWKSCCLTNIVGWHALHHALSFPINLFLKKWFKKLASVYCNLNVSYEINMCWQLFSYFERKYNFDNWFMLTLFVNKLLIPNRTTELFCIIYYTLKQSTLNDMTCLSCHKSVRVRNKTSLRILHLHLRSTFTHNVNPCLLFHLQCCTIYLNESIVLSKEKHNGIWYTYLKIETFSAI